MKTATLVLLEWVDSHIKALKEIEQEKGHSFVIEGGIKALEEVREEILRVSNEVEKPMISSVFKDGFDFSMEGRNGEYGATFKERIEDSKNYFLSTFKTCPQP